MSTGRQIDKWTESEFIQNRYYVWFGSEMPKTISAKEIADNALDQLADFKNTKAREAFIEISKNSVKVMDTGGGITLQLDEETGKSHLFLAVNKLYTSSNYEETDLTGVNGVGATATNALSELFKAGNVRNNKFEGYLFKNGVHKNEGKETDKFEFNDAPYKNGFYVEANYNKKFLEDDINIPWLLDYIKLRVGELPKKSVVKVVTVKENTKDGVTEEIRKEYIFDKIEGSENYVKSWEERVNDIPGSVIVNGGKGWRYAFNKDEDAFENIKSIVKKAPIQNERRFRATYNIEDSRIVMSPTYTLNYDGTALPKYRDQPKTELEISGADIFAAMRKKAPGIYQHYYNLAQERYLKRLISGSDRNSYTPAVGNKNKELIIAEGYSAISAIQSMRDAKTQACLALQGKILNVMSKDLQSAMKSPVVQDIITIVMTEDFDKIIFATDADSDGHHIATLLLGLFHKFIPKYLEEGKVYHCDTPLYVFKKGKQIIGSNNVKDRPDNSWRLSTKKGLGSLSSEEVEMFITNKDTRTLVRLIYDMPDAEKQLEFALVQGGKGWIQ